MKRVVRFATLSLVTALGLVAAANYSTIEIYSDANCASTPVFLSMAEADGDCTPTDECDSIEINSVGYYYRRECTTDRFEYTAELFSDIDYLLIDVFSDDGCEGYLGSNVFLAVNTCQFAAYAVERTESAVLHADGSAEMTVYNDSSCSEEIQYFDLNASMLSEHQCYAGLNKFYTTKYPGTGDSASASASGSSSSISSPSESGSGDDSASVTSDPTEAVTVTSSSSHLGAGAIAGIVIGCIVLVLFLSAFVFWRHRRTERSDARGGIDSPNAIANAGDSKRDGDYYAGHLSPTSGQKTAQSPHSRNSGSMYRGGSSMSGAWDDDTIVAARIPREKIRIQKLISRGGYGEVYVGSYNDQTIAIKTLLPETRKSIRHVNDFLAEVKMMATMDHPRIVQFVGVAWDSLADLCVVSEYMEGGDLRALLNTFEAQRRPVGFDKGKVKIALHVAHALTYLHSLAPPVIHRDLKSKNILLSLELDAKLTDFGISRERVDRTMTAGVGTSLWMAPEVMLGERYDVKADMFSFGVVLSELDLHSMPYAHAKENSGSGRKMPDTAILQKMALGKLRVQFSPGGVEAMVELGNACVSVDPAERPTAAEALYKLHTVLANDLQ